MPCDVKAQGQKWRGAEGATVRLSVSRATRVGVGVADHQAHDLVAILPTTMNCMNACTFRQTQRCTAITFVVAIAAFKSWDALTAPRK